MSRSLFRKEASVPQINRHYGTVSIAVPFRYRWLGLGVGLCMTLLAIIVIFGQFTEKFIVNGYLESTQGVASLYPHTPGVVAKSFKQEGDWVQKGEPLLTIESLSGHVESEILEKLAHKKQALIVTLKHKQKELVSLKKLLIEHYIAKTLYQAKQDELAALQQQLNMVEVEMLNAKNKQSYVIYAPVSGTVSSVLYQIGQHRSLDKPLMKILPSETKLIAALFVPAQQAGFLHRHAKVFIRYDAYPYVHFGHAVATIQSISRTVLTDEEEDKPIRIGKPYYKIMAVLDQPPPKNKQHLRQGMTLSAVMMGTTRSVWQWIFDPLYTFYRDAVA